MAQVTNTFDAFTARGIREALSDAIYRITPEETPFMSNIGRESVSNTYVEWQNDALAATAANAQIEGDEMTSFPAITPTTRLGNYTQISRKLAIVSNTLEAVDKAGRKSEMAYQLALRSAEIKRDIEVALTQNAAGVAGNSSTARVSAGLEAFLRTNTSVGNTLGGTGYVSSTLSGTTQGFPNAAPTDGTQRAFTETILKAGLVIGYNAGSNPKMLMVGPSQKQVVSGFAGIATNRYNVPGEQPGVIIGAADVYVGDFGKVQVVPNRFQRNRTAFLLDPANFSMGVLRPFQTVALAKTGDAEKRAILVEWTLKVKHEGAAVKIADLT